jgi:hypothetical protein
MKSNPPTAKLILTPSSLVLEQNRLTVELLPPTCNLNACLGLTGTFSCIASALQARDPAALSKCLTAGLQGVSAYSLPGKSILMRYCFSASCRSALARRASPL